MSIVPWLSDCSGQMCKSAARAAVAAAASTAVLAHSAEGFTYRQMCEASAATSLDADHFVVASDESNILRIYKRGEAHPVKSVPLASFLAVDSDKASDIEGAAAVGNRIYWISSHSLNKDGEVKERRLRFFATDIVPGSPPSLRSVAAPSAKLLTDVVSASQHTRLNLADATTRKPEERNGFNIEGLAAAPDGHLLIGLRNPLPNDKSILLRLTNPNGVLAGKKAKFGNAVPIDLGGRGIRSIDRVGPGYVILAGPVADEKTFALYQWSGKAAEAPKQVSGVDFGTLHPEAVFAISGTNTIQILSDDGAMQTPVANCADGASEDEQGFRSITVALPQN